MLITEVLKNIQEHYIKNRVATPDEIVEATATSEIFDISEMGSVYPDFEMRALEHRLFFMTSETINTLSLPFTNVIIKTGTRKVTLKNTCFDLENYVHISEVSPFVYIGSITCIAESKGKPPITSVTNFQITDNKLVLENKDKELDADIKEAFVVIHRALHTINNIPKHNVVTYTPNKYKPEYYRRKSAPTIKITNRPIYYIMEKSNKEVRPRNIDTSKGRLTCEYSFKVRGHWRTLHNSNTIGLDRNGQRIVKGYTWIKEYIKGEGELIKRVRLVR